MTDQNNINVSVEMEYKGANEKQILSLAEALKQLKSASSGSQVFTTYSKNLERLATSIRTLDRLRNTKFTGFVGELNKLSNGLKAMGDLGSASQKMNRALTSLSKIPEVLDKLDDGTMSSFTTKVNQLVASLTPLNHMSGNITSMFNAMGKSVNKTANTLNKYDNSQNKVKKSMTGFWGILNTTRLKMLALTYVIGRLVRVVSGWVKSHSDYVENVALFNQSMGQYAEQAGKYAQEVEAMYGIDISQWVRNQGMFMSIARGMGVATDNAYKMSKSLTELAYDMTAMFNIEGGVEEAFTKLKSGITGEIEPLRNLGYALTQATLQEEAYRLGIQKRVTKMTEAEKAELRYQAILRQSATRNVMGAMARELENPASALRILQGQFRTLARELGSLFIPMLVKVMPYIQAMTRVLIDWIRALAKWFGVELPTWENKDFGSLQGGSNAMDDLSDATDGAIGKQKELKGLLAGFDQLNVLDQKSDSGSGGSGGAGMDFGGGGLGIELDEHTGFLFEEMKAKVDALVPSMKELMLKIAGVSGALAMGLAGAKVYSGISTLNTMVGEGGLAGVFTKATTAVSGFLGKTVTLPGVLGGITAPLWAVIAVVTALVVAVSVALVQLWNEGGKFKETFVGVWESIVSMVDQVWTTIEPILSSFANIIGTVLVSSVSYLWEGFKNAIGGIMRVFGELWLLIEPIVTWLIEHLGVVFVGVLGSLGVAFSVVFAGIAYVVGIVFDIIGWFFNLVADGIKYMRENFGGVLSWLGGFFLGAFDGIFTAIGGSLVVFWNVGKSVVSGIWGIFQGLIGFVTGVFTGDWKKAWEGVSKIFSSLVNGWKGVFKGVWDFILNLFNAGGKVFDGISEGIGTVFRNVVNGLIGGINKIIAVPFKVINGMLNGIRSISILGMKPFEKMWGYNPIGIPNLPKLPAYETGTNFVPETGLALLHKGETVIPAKQGKKYESNGGSDDLLEETRRQNALLEAILQKDTSINLDGNKVNGAIKRVDTRRAKALGYTG